MFLLVNDQADDTGNRSGWDAMGWDGMGWDEVGGLGH